MSRSITDLSAQEVLALAVQVEQANAARLQSFAAAFRGYDDEVAGELEALAMEELQHERMLLAMFDALFGGELPSIGEEDVRGVIESADLADAEHLLFGSLDAREVRRSVLQAEREAAAFYREAARAATEAGLSTLYLQLAEMEREHAAALEEGSPWSRKAPDRPSASEEESR